MRRWLLPLLLPACDPGGVALPGEVEVDFPDDVELRVATAAGTTDAPPPPHGARWTVLTGRGRDAVPSPDGTRLAWTRDRPAVLDVATGAVLQELPEGDGCHHPVWSGDGDRIAAWCTLREASQSWVQGRLVVWDPAAQTVVEVVERPPASGPELVWVAPAGAWWIAAPAGSAQRLGTWLAPDGTVRAEPIPSLPAGADEAVGRWSPPAWSADGRQAVWWWAPRRHDPVQGALLGWDGGRLVVQALGRREGRVDDRVHLLPDGVILVRDHLGRWRAQAGVDGEVVWEEERWGALHGTSLAVAWATGSCPRSPPTDGEPLLERRASPDGRWTTTRRGIGSVDGDPTLVLPGGDGGVQVSEARRLRGGQVLVALHGNLHLLDEATGRPTWSLAAHTLVVADGPRLLLRSRAGGLLRVDLAARRAWRTAVRTVDAAEGGAWVQLPDGSLHHVDPRGRVRHAVEAPALPTDVDARLRLPSLGWLAWTYGDALVFASTRVPAQAVVLGDEVVQLPLHDDDGLQGACGRQREPAVGWIDPQGVHVLDDQGHAHLLPWTLGDGDAVALAAALAAPGAAAQALAELGVDRVTVELFRDAADGGPLEASWTLPHDAHADWRAEQEARGPDPAWWRAPPRVFRLSGSGWAIERTDGGMSGRDPHGALLLDLPGAGVRPAPLQAGASPWASMPGAELGPCPWAEAVSAGR